MGDWVTTIGIAINAIFLKQLIASHEKKEAVY
jgi:hypothetical protein